MKIFYYCYGGAHSSVIAAALHLNKLSYPLTYGEIINFTYFDLNSPEIKGTPTLLGTDENKNEIYFVGYGKNKEMIVKLIKSFLQVNGINDDQYLFVDALDKINWRVHLGGFVSKALKQKNIGRRFTALGILLSAKEIQNKVETAKEISKGYRESLTKV